MISKSRLILLTLGFLVLLKPYAYSQIDNVVLSHATTSLEKYTSANPIEKVYLHLDKSNYDPGDTIWYKAYTVIGQHHQLSAMSGVLYVELISPNDTVISRQILQLRSGIAWGDFALPDKATAGNYHIRAYTNWMRNAGAEYFYNQKIHVGGYDTAAVKKLAQAGPDVQFFPESGWLVNGLRSKVAVKVVNASGRGQDIKGTIEDNNGNIIADFATQHLGMGAFAFTPQSGKNYSAKILTGETPFTVPLPAAKEKGYVLGINNNNSDSIFIKVAVNEPMFRQEQHSKFYIAAHSAGKVYYAAAGKLEDRIFTVSVDKKRFPSGIVQFTLFSENGEPLNERIAFIQNDDTLKLNISASQGTAMRQKIKINLGAKTKDSQPAMGTFSVTVVNESTVNPDEASEGTILNKLLLTSDLKGYIEQPNYYFVNPNQQTKANLDILMLTQGYQRYNWKEILADVPVTTTYQPENYLQMEGSITTPGGKPVPNGKVALIATQYNLLADTLTDASGNFNFTDLDLPDSARIILDAKKINNNKNVIITIKPKDYPAIIKQKTIFGMNDLLPDSATAKTTPSNYQRQKLDFLNKKHQLKEVTIKAHKHFVREEPNLDNSANLNGAGHADQVIMADQLKGCVNLLYCLPGIIKGVIFKGKVPINVRVHGMHAQQPMVIYIDGSPQPSVQLEDIDPNIIHSIEVLESPAYLMAYGYDVGGALLITTKRGGDKDFMNTTLASGIVRYTFKGFYKAHEFYSPKYDSPKSNTTIPDLRSTIYWNPNVVTDKDGKATFEYFNADSKGIYRVVVEGIDGEGNLGRQVYRYKVE